MKNFGYLSSLFPGFNIPSFSWGGSSYLTKRFWRNFGRCIFSLIGLIIFGLMLMKVYEVPVYYTKIDLVSDNCTNTVDGKLNIRILRDYDRADKASILQDSTYEEKKDFNYGIYIDGIYRPDYYMSSDSISRINRVKDMLRPKLSEAGKDFNINSQFLYLSVLTSSRQNFLLVTAGDIEDSLIINNMTFSAEEYNGEKFVKKSRFYQDFYKYTYLKNVREHDGVLSENFYVVGKNDTLFDVGIRVGTPAFEKPSVWRTMEDVSKLVEYIEIGHGEREKENYAGAWAFINSISIDYIGPSQFSEVIIPEPDEKTLSSIKYTDKKKIEEIGRYGLRYHVTFPDMENIQEARIFILSALVTALGALFFKYLWRILYDCIRYISSKHKTKNIYIGLIVILILLSIICIMFYTTYVNPFNLTNDLLYR